MKTWKNSPQKLLIIHNQQFFSLPAWQPKSPILDRNRNFIGSPCLLFTISLSCTYLLILAASFFRNTIYLHLGSVLGVFPQQFAIKNSKMEHVINNLLKE